MENNGKQLTKISGYLEKKGKNIMRSSYKKYWFVLEGGLLLYYRSKDDYESISPCKGSVNLGPTTIIKPCPSLVGVFQIQTRTVTITLRAFNLEEQNRWMEALMAEIQPNKPTQKMSHFRYSIENIPKNQISDTTLESEFPQDDIIHRLQKLGAQSYGKPVDVISLIKDHRIEKEEIDRRNSEHIYEMISARNDDKDFDSIKSDVNRPKTYFIENDVYTTAKQEKTESKNESIIIANDTYVSIEGNGEISRDVNENDVSKDRKEEENAYSVPLFDDKAKNDVRYESVVYAEPCELKQTKKKKKKEVKIKDNDKHSTNVKKRSSFINRMWKKKDKRKDDDDEECIYETVRESVVEKISFTDDSTVKMLSELQNILEQKLPILLEKKCNDIDFTTNQNPVENLIESIEKTHGNNADSYQKNPLVPKINEKNFYPPHLDVPTDKPIALPPKRKQINNLKNLDDILNELDNQKTETKKNKVKKLIKKFSEPDFFENDVILRKNNQKYEINKKENDQDELSRLLSELAKVTNAPMLLPGVTCSLNGNHIKDEELSKLVPLKQRRFSEPDYDIPRPHKSLTITQKSDDDSTNVIESTRFFGPILKPSGVVIPEETKNPEIASQLDSIFPDSLETNEINSAIKRENHKSSLKSEFMVDNDLYAEPRSIHSFHKREQDDEDDEVFVDSLEIYKNSN
ncbi:uncharacterized protein LOC130896779 isoform X1 [Diorhabda carinulata]|uniref:uncharacterized protein LOC130896779 isoform X1 n=2 Tax=Diorhabda carinulata TaxID=1163345 RepID=UPI0025A0DD51|nr:uncharacterized protein LOC130896779 isoform X1 [Diorhabda carinulata]